MLNKRNMGIAYGGLIYSVFLLFTLVNQFYQHVLPGKEGEPAAGGIKFFYYFTNQTNIIVLVWLVLFAVAVFKFKSEGKLYNSITSKLTLVMVTFYISVTFLIVVFILTPITSGTWAPLANANEFFLHNASAVVMWLMLFFVKGEGKLTYKMFPYFLIYPTLYLAFSEYIGANFKFTNGKAAYPYPFINPANYENISGLVILIGSLYVIFTIIGMLMIKFKNNVDEEYQK